MKEVELDGGGLVGEEVGEGRGGLSPAERMLSFFH